MLRDEVLEKLVTSLHISVPERLALGKEPLRATEIADIIRRHLENGSVYPLNAKSWRSGEVVFEGFFLEKQRNGRVRLAWQRSHPIDPFTLADHGSYDFDNPDEAIAEFMRREWNNGIDGIKILFTSD